jgi:arginine/lysine/ornithine decarboxylase
MFEKTPLFSALISHRSRKPISMHVPGHKNGLLLHEAGISYYKKISELDVTELTNLDDLHDAEGCIKEAQDLTAQFYGAEETHFLIGGSTAGNLAMILSAFDPGDAVMVQRNCHKSVLNGLELAGLVPIFLGPEIHQEGGFPLGLTLETVKMASEQYPEVKGLIVTTPNYYGMSADLSSIIQYMHERSLPVLADEAHGAHYVLEGFPDSVLSMGADAAVQSAHKTLPAMTMGAYLHIGKQSLLNKNRIRHALQMIQSSSPSYPIMASLDLSRSYLAQLKSSDIELIKEQSLELKDFIKQCGFHVLDAPSGYEADSLKITLQAQWEYTGYEMQSIFEQNGLYPELADSLNVLFVLPLGVSHETMRWKEAILRASKELNSKRKLAAIKFPSAFPPVSSLSYSYSEMRRKLTVKVKINDSAGRISAETVIPYPPGVPLIAKGEQITESMIKAFNVLQKTGARFQGGGGEMISVFAEEEGVEQQ